MEDDSIYNAIIISLIIGIIIVIATLIIARPEKETFTELYFENHENLPKYSNPDNYYSFKFTIHNVENKDFNYTYRISAFQDDKEQIIEENTILIKNNEKETIEKTIKVDVKDKAKIQVTLTDLDQEIHFFVKSNKYYPYEGLGDGKIDCLKTIDINENETLAIKAEGSYADGWPVLEIRINGKLINSTEIKEEKEYKLIPLMENSIVDLSFVNDYNIKEDNQMVADRNIYVSYVKVGDKMIDVIYDKGKDIKAFDCEDTSHNLDMAWNGALRFKTE